MSLPALELERIATSLEGTLPPAPPHERRREARMVFNGEATIIRCDSADRTPRLVRVRDISASGIGITHAMPLVKGDRFIAVLPRELAHVARGVLCTVMHSTPAPGGGFQIGAKFDRLLHVGETPQQILPGRDTPAAPQPNHEAELPAAAEVRAPIEPKVESKVEPAPAAAPIAATSPAKPQGGAAAPIARLLSRDECIQRAEQAMQARTLSGVVAQVIALAASPRSDLSDLASLIARDPMLSARILQAANSASYASTRGMVSTISEAVRNIGCSAVRDIAASLGVFDAMPPCSPDGFNPIRCWQHSFAVATLCQRMADDAESGAAYLTGLCHDLGEILFHTHFGAEYRQVLDAQAATGRGRDELERKMLGMSHGELVVTILRCLGLPDAIRGPIEAFHRAGIAGRGAGDKPTRLLRIAELYANGLLLASSPQSPLMPLTRPECRAATGEEEPARPDGVPLRNEIFALTAMLARLSSKDEAALMAPPYPQTATRVWLAREAAFSGFDPVAAALEALAEVTVQPRLPDAAEAAQHGGMVVVSRHAGVAGLSAADIQRAAGLRPEGRLPVLWLTGSIDGTAAEMPGGIRPVLCPVPITSLAGFVAALASAKGGQAPH
jgi:HD-like signal output (HDOD) protein